MSTTVTYWPERDANTMRFRLVSGTLVQLTDGPVGDLRCSLHLGTNALEHAVSMRDSLDEVILNLKARAKATEAAAPVIDAIEGLAG